MITIAGPASSFVDVSAIPIAYLKRRFEDEWEFRPELAVERFSHHSAASDLDTCELRYRYGEKRESWESAFAARGTLDLDGYYVLITLVGPQGEVPQWAGLISTETRDVKNTAGTPAGAQPWTAYGPYQILRKLDFSQQRWKIDGQAQLIAFSQPFNRRDDFRRIKGNRSTERLFNGAHAFSGADGEVWTRREMAEYVVLGLVDRSRLEGPEWTLSGQLDALDEMTDPVELGVVNNAADALRAIIPVARGVDFEVLPVFKEVREQGVKRVKLTGFDVHVFALSDVPWSFGSVTMPGNPTVHDVRLDQTAGESRTRVVRTADHRYRVLRVVGKRIIVCCTLAGPLVETPWIDPFIDGWTPELEAEYRDPNPGGADLGATTNDEIRRAERFRAVYQDFAAPADWDFNEGSAEIVVFSDGSATSRAKYLQSLQKEALAAGRDLAEVTVASREQRDVRRTLNWLPLFDGVVYSVNPPDETNKPEHPEFMKPQAWVFDELLDQITGLPAWERIDRPARDPCDISVKQNDWGLHLDCEPNHVMGRNTFDSGFGSVKSTNTRPSHDWQFMVMTLAYESSQRFGYEFFDAGAVPEDGAHEEEIDAELWWIAPGTVTDADGGELGGIGFFARPDGLVLRDDHADVEQAMAGLILRYTISRNRASIELKGLWPLADLVGDVLRLIEPAGDLAELVGPVTGVQFTAGGDNRPPMTVIELGLALA